MRTVLKFAIIALRARKGTVPRTLVGRTRYHIGIVTLMWAGRKLRWMLLGDDQERVARSLAPGESIRLVSVPTRRGSRRELRKLRRQVQRDAKKLLSTDQTVS